MLAEAAVARSSSPKPGVARKVLSHFALAVVGALGAATVKHWDKIVVFLSHVRVAKWGDTILGNVDSGTWLQLLADGNVVANIIGGPPHIRTVSHDDTEAFEEAVVRLFRGTDPDPSKWSSGTLADPDEDHPDDAPF